MTSTDSAGGTSSSNRFSLQDLIGSLNELAGQNGDSDLELVELAAGEVLFEQGDEGDSLYILIAGVLGVRVTNPDGTVSEIDRLAPGARVGELALVSGQKRSATVYAVNDAGLIRVTRGRFEQMSEIEKSSLVEMDTTAAERWQRLQLSQVLQKLFGDLDVMALHEMQEKLIWRRLDNGEILFRHGDDPDGMYLIVNGRLRFHSPAIDERGDITGEIGAGETVGEFALLNDDARSATVYALRESNVVKLTQPVFEALGREYPALVREITRIIVARQQKSLKKAKPYPPDSLNLALVPADPNVDVALFAKELEAALRQIDSATALTAAEFNRQYGQQGAANTASTDPINPAIVSWLGELEAANRYTLFVADYDMSPWTERCIGQADRVIIVAAPNHSPAPGPVEESVTQGEFPLRTELVLWHPSTTERPSGTLPWLEARPNLHAHHHVRQGDEKHMGRLARRLTGHAVSLVFSGGAARGFAELGVHRAFEELDIPIDYIGGTSMGAIMAGSIFMAEDNAGIMKLAEKLSDPKALTDRTFPVAALMGSKKVTEVIKGFFSGLQIEDLWIPFLCVASNLTTAETVIYERGPLWRAIRASVSIPGLYVPVMQDGDIIVDGSVMNNIPIKLISERSESDYLIAVDVNPIRDKKRYYDYETHLSGWRVFLSRYIPFMKRHRAPNIIAVILRSMDLNSLSRAKEEYHLADLVIKPEVSKFGLQNYTAYEALAQKGYEDSIELLREWKQERLENIL